MSSHVEVQLAEDFCFTVHLEDARTMTDFEMALDDEHDVLVDIPANILTDVAATTSLDADRLLAALALRETDDLLDIVHGLAKRRASLDEALADGLAEQKELQNAGAGIHQTIVHLRNHLQSFGLDPGAPKDLGISFAFGAAGVFLQSLAQPVVPKDDFNLTPTMVKDAAQKWLHKSQEFGQLVSSRLTNAPDGTTVSKPSRLAESKLGTKGAALPTLIENMKGGAAVSTCPAEKAQDHERPPTFGYLFSYFSNPGEKPSVAPSSAGPDSDAPPACPETTATSASEWIATLDSGLAEEADNDEGSKREPLNTWASSLTDLFKGGIFKGAAATLSKIGAEKHRCRIAEEDMANIEENYCFARDKVVAQITLANGKVAVCTVATDDKCKDAAKRFVSEHFLHSSVKAPLRAYLKKCQASATSFPVQVRTSLKEICVQ